MITFTPMNIASTLFRYTALAFVALCLVSCNNKTEYQYNEEFWVGNQMIISGHIARHDIANPLSLFLEFINDSLYLNSYKNETSLKSEFDFSRAKKGDTLKFLNAQFVLHINRNQAFLKSVVKNNQYQEELHFHKPIKTPHWKKEIVLNTLTKSAFTTSINKTTTPNTDFDIKKTLQFTADSLTTTFTYYYSNNKIHQETHTKSYYLSEINGTYFFAENDDPHNPHKLYQIIDVEKNSFGLYYYDDQKEIFENYSLFENDIKFNATSYQNCNEMRPSEYYSGNYKYLKGIDYIIERVSKNAPKATGNGFITVHFNINCDNQKGQLGLEMMDRNYQSKSFDVALVNHIVQEVLKLEDWPENTRNNDIHAFLMFKIENGKITDLCP
jgi:hypothetical protein